MSHGMEKGRTILMYTAPNLLSFSRIAATIVVFVLVIVNQPCDTT
jgi:hypothetical protein